MTRGRCLLTGLVIVVALTGCVPVPDAAAARRPANATARPSDAVEVSATSAPHSARELPAPRASASAPTVRAASIERVIRHLTVRVRAVGCHRTGTASGVAVGPHTLITNQHVVADAAAVELNHWDGSSARARVVAIAAVDDLAVVHVDGQLPAVGRLAETDPAAGTDVLAAGYPHGGVQTVERGRIIEYAPLATSPDASAVMRLSTPIVEGNSGGPVVDVTGAVVGVVFGIETATGYGVAVPASALRRLLAAGSSPPATPPCAAQAPPLSDSDGNGIVTQ